MKHLFNNYYNTLLVLKFVACLRQGIVLLGSFALMNDAFVQLIANRKLCVLVIFSIDLF